jgi:hypothetical protein
VKRKPPKNAPTDDVDRFFSEALGGFCWNVSITESNVKSALYRFADVQQRMGNAVFSDVSVDRAMHLVHRA